MTYEAMRYIMQVFETEPLIGMMGKDIAYFILACALPNCTQYLKPGLACTGCLATENITNFINIIFFVIRYDTI